MSRPSCNAPNISRLHPAPSYKGRRWRINYDHMGFQTMNDILKAANYDYFEDFNRYYLDGMRASMAKIDNGILPYAHYSKAELRGFFKTRGLPPPKKRTTKRELCMLLEAADANPRFPHFLDLPTEIRNMIYEFSMTSLAERNGNEDPDKLPDESVLNVGKDLLLPAVPLPEPGILQASRLTRAEASYVFYSTKTFCFEIFGRIATRGLPPRITVDPVAQLFLRGASDKNIASIKHFKYRFADHSYAAPGYAFSATICKAKASVVDYIFRPDKFFDVIFNGEEDNVPIRRHANFVLHQTRSDMARLAAHAGHLTGPLVLTWMEKYLTRIILLKEADIDRHWISGLPKHLAVNII